MTHETGVSSLIMLLSRRQAVWLCTADQAARLVVLSNLAQMSAAMQQREATREAARAAVAVRAESVLERILKTFSRRRQPPYPPPSDSLSAP